MTSNFPRPVQINNVPRNFRGTPQRREPALPRPTIAEWELMMGASPAVRAEVERQHEALADGFKRAAKRAGKAGALPFNGLRFAGVR